MNKAKAYLLFLMALLSSLTALATGRSQHTQPKANKSAQQTQRKHNLRTWFDPNASNHDRYINLDAAKSLAWVNTPQPNSLCSGYFAQPKNLLANPNPKNAKNQVTTISAKHSRFFSKDNRAILYQNVRVTQPGRLLTGDKAYLYRDTSGKLKTIDVLGRAKYQQANELILGTDAHLYTQKNILHINQGLYHLVTGANGTQAQRDIWGHAASITRYGDDQILVMKNATYSTCSPIRPVWHVSASKLTLNKKTGRGQAKNVVLTWKRIPFFYAPYYSFPIDNRRKTGLLTPTLAHSHTSGIQLTAPFYWNLAPNYDDLITPIWYSKRGIQANNLFRYMGGHQTTGQLYLSFLPGDNAFNHFKQAMQETYAGNSSKAAYLTALNQASTNRGFISAKHTTTLNKHWAFKWDANYVTDPYYFQDFAFGPGQTLANQLENHATINYQSSHWHAQVLTQAFQTLHPINQAATNNQYQLLPQVNFGYDYPNIWHHFDASMSNEWTYFNFENNAFSSTNHPTGQRLHLRPGLSLPMQSALGYITPAIWLDNTNYNIKHPNPNGITSKTRNLPITNIKTGLFLERKTHWGSHHFTQTLEPEISYLYVPYEYQQNLPVFNTQRLPFNYSQVLALNEFNGLDRIQNANQFGLSLSSRILNSDSGATRLNTQLGMIVYLTNRRVKLNDTDPTETNHLSDLAAQTTFTPNDRWSETGSLVWSWQNKTINNASISAAYRQTPFRTFNLGYQYVLNGDTNRLNDLNERINLNLINAGVSWKLNPHWNSVNYINYNLGQHLMLGFFSGLQYDSCCWDINFLVNRSLIGYNPDNRPKMETAYFFQLTFKGLGSFGKKTPRAMIQGLIPGFSPLNNFGR